MPVPYLFSNVPGGTSIPLAELDANFAYFTSGTPTFLNLDVSGNLTVHGTTTLIGLLTTGDIDIGGSITINGTTVLPTGITGTGKLVFNIGPTLIDPIFTSPTLGTPDSGNLSNCTGYPITNLTGAASGIITFLTNPSSGNLAAAVTDETGTGNLVFSNNPVLSSPTLTNPVLGTPVSGNLVNCTGYPATNLTGITPVVRGGTGLSTTGSVGEVLIVTAPGVVGYAASPAALSVAGGAASQILYQSAPNTTDFIDNGTVGQVLVSNGALVPAWGKVNATTSISGVLPTANGGTGIAALGTGVQTGLGTAVNTTGGFITYPNGVAPTGSVMFFAMSTAPAGWLIANGAEVSRATYAALFTAIGTLYGAGNGSSTFNLPNLNGQFLRGWDGSGSVDPGRVFGSTQADAFESHTHAPTVSDPGHAHTIQIGQNNSASYLPGGGMICAGYLTGTDGAFTGITVTIASTGGTETRPTNVALLACIKT